VFARFLRSSGSIIDHGLKIVGSIVSEGAVEVNGQIQGDLQCAKLFISPKSCINGSIQAQQVVVNGRVEGPHQGRRGRFEAACELLSATFKPTLLPSDGAPTSMAGRRGPTRPISKSPKK